MLCSKFSLPLRQSALSQKLSQGFANVASVQHIKKFYKEATVEDFDDGKNKGFTVKLDGRGLKSADGHPYYVPSARLAHIVAMEFLAQQEHLITATMPLVGCFD